MPRFFPQLRAGARRGRLGGLHPYRGGRVRNATVRSTRKRPSWTESDLAELGPTLRSFVAAKQVERDGDDRDERTCPPPCGRRFRPAVPSHVFCSAACKQRAYRQQRQAPSPAAGTVTGEEA